MGGRRLFLKQALSAVAGAGVLVVAPELTPQAVATAKYERQQEQLVLEGLARIQAQEEALNRRELDLAEAQTVFLAAQDKYDVWSEERRLRKLLASAMQVLDDVSPESSHRLRVELGYRPSYEYASGERDTTRTPLWVG
jgi:hypothetical protein